MSQVSVYIIVFNEAEKVRATIESVRWADEIVVVDSWSTDGTAAKAVDLQHGEAWKAPEEGLSSGHARGRSAGG